MAKLIAQAIASAGRLDSREHWTKSDFAEMRRDLDELFGAIEAAQKAAAELALLASPANRQRIANWANQCELEIEINLPNDYGWPVTPALDALRVASGGATDRDVRRAA